MKCQEARELMSDYLEQILADPQTDLLHQHLTGCEDCRTELADLQQTLDVLHGLPRLEPVFDLWTEFAPRMADIPGEEPGTWDRIRRYFSSVRNTLSEGWMIWTTVVRFNTSRRM